MGKSNKEVIHEFYDRVLNGKDVDSIPYYFADEFHSRTAPYVGLGLFPDQAIDDKAIILSVAKGGPSDGKIFPGDELLSAEDDKRRWDTYEDLKAGVWGQGIIGTDLKLTVKRNGAEVEVTLTRGRVEGFDFNLEYNINSLKNWLTVGCPDLKVEILHIIAEGDLVAVYSQFTATVTDYNQQAIWIGCEIDRLKDGKFVEAWDAGVDVSYFTQLGFKLEPPVA